MAVKMRLIGGEWGVKMAPENGGTGTTLARSTLLGTADDLKAC